MAIARMLNIYYLARLRSEERVSLSRFRSARLRYRRAQARFTGITLEGPHGARRGEFDEALTDMNVAMSAVETARQHWVRVHMLRIGYEQRHRGFVLNR